MLHNAPGRNRTVNLTIKSRLLCQLSYRCVPRFVPRFSKLVAWLGQSLPIKRRLPGVLACSAIVAIDPRRPPKNARHFHGFFHGAGFLA